jgi:glutathione S-transferase
VRTNSYVSILTTFNHSIEGGTMEYTIIIISIALLQYIFFTFRVGFSRGKFGVNAPKTVGDDTWERMYRVQQNTMEQLVIFIPGIIAFTLYVSEMWALLPGVLFIVGRQVYSQLYIKNPESRAPGMVLSFFSNIGMVLATLIGIGINMAG